MFNLYQNLIIRSMDNQRFKGLGLSDSSELTLQKLVELQEEGSYDANESLEDGCPQTFEIRHCYWCGKPNCVNPAWPVWFCYNGNHPN